MTTIRPCELYLILYSEQADNEDRLPMTRTLCKMAAAACAAAVIGEFVDAPMRWALPRITDIN